MNKTIYVRDEDAGVWERARELAGEKLSPILIEGLRKFIADKEAEQKGFGRIIVTLYSDEGNRLPVAKAFYGRWLVPPEEPVTRSPRLSTMKKECYAAATTAKNNLVVYRWLITHAGRKSNELFLVFRSVEKALADATVCEGVRAVILKHGIPIEELDI